MLELNDGLLYRHPAEPESLAISLRSTRSPERSLPVSTRLTMCETTRSFSLTPYFLGMAR